MTCKGGGGVEWSGDPCGHPSWFRDAPVTVRRFTPRESNRQRPIWGKWWWHHDKAYSKALVLQVG
jgi:hypothetical protein